MIILFTPLDKAEADNGTNLVPQWIKHVALLWSQGEISDNDFINSMTWLVENKILPVTDLVEELDAHAITSVKPGTTDPDGTFDSGILTAKNKRFPSSLTNQEPTNTYATFTPTCVEL